MDSSPVRVVLPGGDAFVGAFVDAAATYSERRGQSPDDSACFVHLIDLACTCVNSTAPASVEMTLNQRDGAASAAVQASGPTKAIAAKAATNFIGHAESANVSFEIDEKAPAIRFTLELSK